MNIGKMLSTMLMLSFFLGCQPQNSNQSENQGHEESSAHYYRYAVMKDDITSIDPVLASKNAELRILSDLFEPLTTQNLDGDLLPGAASSWKSNSDFTVWTFNIDSDRKWSNGDRVTASDFVYAWRRLVDPATSSPFGWYFSLMSIENVDAVLDGTLPPVNLGISAISSTQLQITLSKGLAYFPKLTTLPLLAPLHQPSINAAGSEWLTPGRLVSNGAYVLSSFSDARIELVKNEHYDNSSNLFMTRVTAEIFTSEQLALDAFDNDLIDEMVAPYFLTDADEVAYADELLVHPRLCNYYYIFNMNDSSVSDVRVRRALSYAIDRKNITGNVIGSGQFEAFTFTPTYTSGFVAPELAWANVTQAERNSEALTLMEAAGYNEGNKLAIELYYNISEGHRSIASAMKQHWLDANLPVTVTLREDDWTTFLTTRGSGNFQLGRSAWCGDFNDPYTFLHILESTSEYNDGSFSNTAFDTLIADSAVTDTPESLYTQAEDILSDQVPIIPVYFYSGRVLLKRNIRGYAINNIEQYRYTKDLTRL